VLLQINLDGSSDAVLAVFIVKVVAMREKWVFRWCAVSQEGPSQERLPRLCKAVPCCFVVS
jgi:hypothetical protein